MNRVAFLANFALLSVKPCAASFVSTFPVQPETVTPPPATAREVSSADFVKTRRNKQQCSDDAENEVT
jgi:hypothetical protein